MEGIEEYAIFAKCDYVVGPTSSLPHRATETVAEQNKPRKGRKEHQTNYEISRHCLRARHGVEPLTYSQELSDMAPTWAEHLMKIGKFEHSPEEHRKGAGENVAFGFAHLPVEGAMDFWYNEVKDYNCYGGEPHIDNLSGFAHFTQVVWKSTQEVGIGMTKGPNGSTMVVANYRPPGNMLGAYAENVFPPK